MSVLEQIADLEAQKQKLMAKAHKEALGRAESAVAALNELGFNYKLSGGKTAGKRRTGIRSEVLNTIKRNANGITRKDLLSQMGAEDKAGQQSISNAVSALKKAGAITGEGGIYKST